ncbi:hypothetical protein N8Z26_07725, partial [Burkholderiales bacterium]|nr:hypothetical protein [Burkholderiales bacterium]
ELFREETITDRKVGTIRVLTPITSSGERDANRETIYAGETQIMTPMGALPIAFQIEAGSLPKAVEGYGDAGKAAVEKAVRELQEMRREQASSIVLPGGAQGGIPGSGPGGGIKLP